MEDDLIKELEDLRAENKILRDSLTVVRDEGPGDDDGTNTNDILGEMSGALHSVIGQAKEYLRPGTEKLTEGLSRQMDSNPVPLLIAAFGAGYLLSRRRERK